MPFCPNCGAQVTDDQKLCLECGKPIKQEKPKREGFLGYFLMGIITIFLPIIGLIYVALFRGKKPRTTHFILVESIIFLIIWVLIILAFAAFWLQLLVAIFTPSTEMIFLL